MLKFYTGDSPNGIKVKIALCEMEIDHEEEFLELFAGAARTPEYLAINPYGKVPAVVDGDVVIWESGAILLYLADHYGKLLPKEPKRRAEAVQYVVFEAANLAPTLGGTGIVGQLMRPEAERNQPLLVELGAALERQIALLDTVLSDGREYLAGEFSIADCQLFPGLSKGVKLGLIKPGPSLAGWVERVAARPAVVRALASVRAQPATPR
jgi:GST-like protein